MVFYGVLVVNFSSKLYVSTNNFNVSISNSSTYLIQMGNSDMVYYRLLRQLSRPLLRVWDPFQMGFHHQKLTPPPQWRDNMRLQKQSKLATWNRKRRKHSLLQVMEGALSRGFGGRYIRPSV